MILDPLLGELIQLVLLVPRVARWCEPHFEPTDQITLDQVKCKVRVLSMDAFGGLGNRKPLSVVPNNVAMPGVNIRFFQHHPDNIGHFVGELPLVRAEPVDKVIDQGLVFKGITFTAMA